VTHVHVQVANSSTQHCINNTALEDITQAPCLVQPHHEVVIPYRRLTAIDEVVAANEAVDAANAAVVAAVCALPARTSARATRICKHTHQKRC
jgi:hypothetical protein